MMDVAFGADILEEALELQYQLIQFLQADGYETRKGVANHNSVISHSPVSYVQTSSLNLYLDSDTSSTTTVCTKRFLVS